MITIKHINFIHILGSVTTLALVTLLVALLLPVVGMGANAEETDVTIPVEVRSGYMLSLGLSHNNVSMEAPAPTKDGVFTSGSVKLMVETNATDGYKLYVNTASDNTALSKISAGSVGEIVSINTTAAGGENFPKDQWGYSLVEDEHSPSTSPDATTYQPLKGKSNMSDPVETKNSHSANYTLSFGTKVSTDLPAGTYRNEVIVSAVTNPEEIITMDQITTMQEMNSTICKNTLATNAADLPAGSRQIVTPGNEPSKQLIDIRDGKKYWVSKLADQNCWMTQNLDLDITQTMINDGSLNSSNTDLGYTGTGELATENGTIWSKGPTINSSTDGSAECPAGTSIDEGGNCKIVDGKVRYIPESTITVTNANPITEVNGKFTNTFSWDLGQYAFSRPQWNQECNDPYPHWGGECKKIGLYDVSDSTKWQPTYDSANDPINAGKTDKEYQAIKCTEGTEAFSADGKLMTSWCTAGEYDPHYLVGNYYQWNTATAGSGGLSANPSAKNSICPKGWRLTNGTSDVKNDYQIINEVYKTPLGAPMYLTPAGNLTAAWIQEERGGTLIELGTMAYSWTAFGMPKDTGGAYVYKDETLPLHQTLRVFAFGVRCIAR